MRGAAVVRTALCTACAGALAFAQQPPAAPAPAPASSLTGIVMAAQDDAPLRRARVEVSAGRRSFDPVLTDDHGRFDVPIAGAGPFTLTVAKAGYMTASTALMRADVAAPLAVRLPRGAVIAGVVIDQHGRPVPQMPVVARRRPADEPADGAPIQYQAITDDLGEYRLYGLARGTYELSAGARVLPTLTGGLAVTLDNRPLASPFSSPRAAPVLEVDAGDAVAGVQLQVEVVDSSARSAALALAIASQGLPPPASNAAVAAGVAGITGRVLSEAGEPLDDVFVRIAGAGFDQTVRTDPDGRFALFGLGAGEYTIEASRPGYARRRYGQDRAGQAGRPVRVRAGETVDGVEMALPRGLVMSGTIVDEHGEPLQGVRVWALRVQYASGQEVAAAVGVERRTDDRGMYRLPGLLPGTYIVAASMDAALSSTAGPRADGYAPLFYPGAPTAAAAVPIDVDADQAGLNLTLVPSPAARIHGAARSGDAPLVSGTATLAARRGPGTISLEPRSVDLQPDGRFAFSNVTPGDYVVQVQGDGPGRTGLFGTAPVSIADERAVEVAVNASYGATLEGRIVLEGEAQTQACTSTSIQPGLRVLSSCRTEAAARFGVVPVPLDDRSRARASFVVSGDTFYITGLFGETGFALQRTPGDDWYLKALTIDGIDVAERGFDFGAGPQTIGNAEIVLSRRSATIAGRLREGEEAADYFVVVFPALRDQWVPHSRRLKFTRARADGSFRVPGLPPGDYLVAAVDRLEGTPEAGEWQNVAVLQQLAPLAQRVSVKEEEVRETTLRLIRR